MPAFSHKSAKRLYLPFILSLQELLWLCQAFAPNHQSSFQQWMRLTRQDTSFLSSTILSSTSESVVESDPLEGLSDERKANLFQCLLRDLEIEQVPVLGVDAEESHVFQAALWTTMGELSENDIEDKVCLVFESIPVEKLKMFVNEFDAIKADTTMIKQLPELQRFNVSLVGKGVGPALVLASCNRTNVEKEAYQSMKRSAPAPDQIRWTAAMKAFVARTSPTSVLGSIVNRIVGSTDVCDIMSVYWTSICELLAQLPETDQKASIVFSYPPTMHGVENDRRDRYTSISLLINRMNALFGDDAIGNLHVFPLYDRDTIPGLNMKAVSLGHLASSSQISGQESTEEHLSLQNYGRRSPLPGVIIQRVDQIGNFDKDAALYVQQRSKEELEVAVRMEEEIIAPFELK